MSGNRYYYVMYYMYIMIKNYVLKLMENLPENITTSKTPMKIDLIMSGGAFNGSYILGRPLNNTSYNNSTIAGSSLYASGSQSSTRWDSEGQAMTFIASNGSGNSLVNTGSWRCVSIAPGNGINSGLGTDGYGQLGLWVRYA